MVSTRISTPTFFVAISNDSINVCSPPCKAYICHFSCLPLITNGLSSTPDGSIIYNGNGDNGDNSDNSDSGDGCDDNGDNGDNGDGGANGNNGDNGDYG